MNLATRLPRLIVVLSCAILLQFAAIAVCRVATRTYAAPRRLPVPSGYGVDGRLYPESRASCHLLRVTADDCPYCRQDAHLYGRLLDAAASAGCGCVELAPRAGQMAPREDGRAVQLKFVDLKFGFAFSPFLTPQTFLLGKSGDVQWQQQGALNERALARAMASLRALR